jgi:hypothetical protein
MPNRERLPNRRHSTRHWDRNASATACPCIYERDDGRFQIGIDGPGPFETRRFAEAVANRASGDPPDKRRRPGSGKPGRYSLDRDAAATDTYATAELLSRVGLLTCGGVRL